MFRASKKSFEGFVSQYEQNSAAHISCRICIIKYIYFLFSVDVCVVGTFRLMFVVVFVVCVCVFVVWFLCPRRTGGC